MFQWIYNLPIWLVFFIFTGVCVLVAAAGTLAMRRSVRKWFGPEPGKNEMVTMVLTVGGVFYGLLLGLVAAAAYQSYADAEGTVTSESSAIGTLYRLSSAFPEPKRTELRGALKSYTRGIVTISWPEQQRTGREVAANTARMDAVQDALLSYKPRDAQQEALYSAALDQFSSVVELRRERVAKVGSGLPDVLWWVIVLGALLNLVLLWLFSLDSLKVHLLLSGLFAFFLGMMVFLIAALDYPFRGELSITPEAYQIILDGLMRK